MARKGGEGGGEDRRRGRGEGEGRKHPGTDPGDGHLHQEGHDVHRRPHHGADAGGGEAEEAEIAGEGGLGGHGRERNPAAGGAGKHLTLRGPGPLI
jgi:hypothetical protein